MRSDLDLILDYIAKYFPIVEYDEYVIDTPEKLRKHPDCRMGDTVSVPKVPEFKVNKETQHA